MKVFVALFAVLAIASAAPVAENEEAPAAAREERSAVLPYAGLPAAAQYFPNYYNFGAYPAVPAYAPVRYVAVAVADKKEEEKADEKADVEGEEKPAEDAKKTNVVQTVAYARPPFSYYPSYYNFGAYPAFAGAYPSATYYTYPY